MIHILKTISLIILAFALILLAVANRQEASINIPFFDAYTLTMPTYLFFFAFLFIGTFIGAIFMVISYASHSRKELKFKQKIKQLEKELDSINESSTSLTTTEGS